MMTCLPQRASFENEFDELKLTTPPEGLKPLNSKHERKILFNSTAALGIEQLVFQLSVKKFYVTRRAASS